MIANCKKCGKQFTKTNKRIYCSLECSKAAQDERQIELREIRKFQRQQRNKAKEKTVKIDNIPYLENLARKQGISYGQLKAMEYLKEVD